MRLTPRDQILFNPGPVNLDPEIQAHLRGELSEPDCREAIRQATRRYAKRQETWFRNQLRTRDAVRGEREVWALDATEAPELLAQRILERWNSIPAHHSPRTAHDS